MKRSTSFLTTLSVGFTALWLAAPAAAAPKLTVESVTGAPGSTVEVPVKFDPGGSAISSIQLDLTLPPDVSTGPVKPGELLKTTGKSVGANLMGNRWRFIIFGLNQNPIGSQVLFTAQVVIAPTAAERSVEIPVSGVVYADPAGGAVKAGKSKAGALKIKKPS